MWRRVLGRHNPTGPSPGGDGVGQSISELPLEVSVQKEWNLGLGASCILVPPKPAVADLNVNLPD